MRCDFPQKQINRIWFYMMNMDYTIVNQRNANHRKYLLSGRRIHLRCKLFLPDVNMLDIIFTRIAFVDFKLVDAPY